MRILDKYILKEFLGPFVFGVAAFTAIFVGSDTLLKIADFIAKYGASPFVAAKLFLLAIPRIIIYTFPMAILLGSLMCFSRLSSASELIVMRTSGQSFVRLAMPVFLTAFCISLGTVAFNEFVVPWTNNEYSRIVREEVQRNMKPASAEHVVIRDVQAGAIEHLLYARNYDDATRKLNNITIQEFEKDQVVRVEKAPYAEWRGGTWYIRNGTIYELKEDGTEHTLQFEEQTIPYASQPQDIVKSQKNLDEMTIRELNQERRILREAHEDTATFDMEIQQRFSLPFASFIFALMGSPLGVQRQRSSSIGFGIAVVIIFFYYATMTLSGSLGRSHAVIPELAVWIPNFIAFLVSAYLIRRVSK